VRTLGYGECERQNTTRLCLQEKFNNFVAVKENNILFGNFTSLWIGNTRAVLRQNFTRLLRKWPTTARGYFFGRTLYTVFHKKDPFLFFHNLLKL